MFKIVTVILLSIIFKGVISTEQTNQLLSKLLDNYSINTRPVLNKSTVVNVVMRIVLFQIRDIDEKNQIVISNVWIRFFWRDEFLQWNPKDYGGIERMHVRSSLLWQPDIVLYNSVDTKIIARDFMADTNAELTPDGNVSWTAPAMLKSSCNIRVGDYPFDVQKCNLKFGSWTYNGYEINVTSMFPELVMDSYMKNGEWEVQAVPCDRNEVFYSCCPEPFPDITCSMVLRRLPLFYIYNIVFPCVMLIIIGGLVFILPPESGERISLSVTLLLAMTVFMLVIMGNIPETSETVPSLEEFIGATIVLLSIATMTSILVVNFHHKGSNNVRPPRWAKKLMNGFAFVFCMKKISLDQDMADVKKADLVGLRLQSHNLPAENGYWKIPPTPIQERGSRKSSRSEVFIQEMPSKKNSRSDVYIQELPLITNGYPVVDPLHEAQFGNPWEPKLNMSYNDRSIGGHTSEYLLKEIYKQLNSMKKKVEKNELEAEEFADIKEEWSFIVRVLDRAFLIIFSILAFFMLIKFTHFPPFFDQSRLHNKR